MSCKKLIKSVCKACGICDFGSVLIVAAVSPESLHTSQNHENTTEGRALHLVHLVFTSNLVRALRSALYSMLTSALPPPLER